MANKNSHNVWLCSLPTYVGRAQKSFTTLALARPVLNYFTAIVKIALTWLHFRKMVINRFQCDQICKNLGHFGKNLKVFAIKECLFSIWQNCDPTYAKTIIKLSNFSFFGIDPIILSRWSQVRNSIFRWGN